MSGVPHAAQPCLPQGSSTGPALLLVWVHGCRGAGPPGHNGCSTPGQGAGWLSGSAGHGVGEGVGSWRPPGMRMMVTTRKVAMPDRMLNMVSRV